MTRAPEFDADDYALALARLAPTGEVWPKGPGSTFTLTMQALAGSPARNHAAANALLVDAFPATAVDLLPEWEATVGLPNACSPIAGTDEERQRQVMAKLADTGGASWAYFSGILAAFGYTDQTVEQFQPFRVGIDSVDTPLYSNDWAHAWWVSMTGISVDVDASATCEIAAIAPAHTILWFDIA